MSIGIWVPSEVQFGAAPPERARCGAVVRAVATAVQRSLFGEGGGEKEAATFARAWQESWANQESVNAIVAALAGRGFVAPAEADAAAAGQDDAQGAPSQVADGGGSEVGEADQQINALFCVTLFGLCMRLAEGRVGAGDASLDADDADGADEFESDAEAAQDDEEDAVETRPRVAAEPLAAESAEVMARIADLLLQLAPPRGSAGAGAKPRRAGKAAAKAKKPGRDQAKLLAKALLECLLKTMPDTFRLEEQSREYGETGPITRQRIVVRARNLPSRINALLADLPYRFTMQPLREPARYANGDRLAAENETRIHVPLISYRRSNDFLRRFTDAALVGKKSRFDFRSYTKAINFQQAVPWRINVALLLQARCLAELAGGREDWSEATAAAVVDAGLDDAAIENWRNWTNTEFYKPVPGERKRKRYHLPGEFLDSLMVRQALKHLAPTHGAPVEFYLPWKADYRGRIYAETPWLTPQGGDLQRALFELARGRPLDDAGVTALRRHGANLAKRQLVLDDLQINDRRVVKLDERERWVIAKEEDILRSAEAPLRHSFWREASSKPMQFLAFCLAYWQWKTDPEASIHLAVQIDGTCNGLQHIAALTGDETLARAVNVMPREDGLPADIYSELAAAARETVGSIAPLLTLGRKPLPAPLTDILVEADAQLKATPDWLKWLDRDAAKAVVMTVPYGASAGSQTQDVLSKLEKVLETIGPDDEAWQTGTRWAERIDEGTAKNTKAKTGKASGKRTKQEETAGTLLARWARGSFREAREQLRKPATRDINRQKLRAQRAYGAIIAHVMVEHLRAALERGYPAAGRFSAWLRSVADHCEGLPLMWLSPLGLPVCQDKFIERPSKLSARLRNGIDVQDISVGTVIVEEFVSARNQRQALLPNLIHSFDASHLAMMLNAAAEHGIADIGSIHDCLLCHPDDAEKMSEIARAAFAELYRPAPGGAHPEVLEQWSQWMFLIGKIAALPHTALVSGALDVPDGEGENRLKSEANVRNEVRALAAQRSKAVLEEIRNLDPPRRALAEILLGYANKVPRPDLNPDPDEPGKPRKRLRKQHVFYGDLVGKRSPIEKKWPALDPAGILPLDRGLSDFFFS